MTDSIDGLAALDEQLRLRRAQLDGGATISEEEFRHLADVSYDMLAVTDFDGYFRLLNPAWESVLGYSRTELRSKPFIEFVHPDDRGKTDVVSAKIRPGVDLLSFHNRYIAKDGTVRLLHWKAIVSNEAQRYYTVCRDMTDELKARETLAALDALCELCRSGVVAQDAGGTITRWDGACEELFDLPTGSLVGTDIGDVLNFVDGSPMDLIAASEYDEGVPGRLLRRSQAPLNVQVNAVPYGDGHQAATGAIATLLLRPDT